MFSNDGPYLINPEVTNKPKVIPKIYKLIKSKINGTPILKIETPNKGIANKAAGTIPIKVLTIAVKVKAAIISLIFQLPRLLRRNSKVLNVKDDENP